MKGWEIFMHSVRLVFSNIDAAIRVSLVPYALSGLAFVFLGAEAMAVMQDADPEALAAAGPGLFSGFLLYGLVALIAFLWIAVSWHRYVLLEEYPNSWVPAFHGGRMASYFGRLVLIVLLIAVVVLVASLVLGFVVAGLGGAGAFLMVGIVYALSTYLFYRLCPVLPSAAVGKPMTFGEAWNATANSGSAIAVLVVLLILLSLVIQIPNQIGSPDSVIGIIYSLVVGWFMMLIGSSVLTTFYGHFIEGRAID